MKTLIMAAFILAAFSSQDDPNLAASVEVDQVNVTERLPRSPRE